jgi:sec-independent protein translocase protein TatB
MFGMGGTEIIVILIVALLFLGPDKLPDAARKISQGIRDIKKQTRVLQRTIEDDEHIGGAIRDLRSALRGEEEPIRPPKAAKPALPEPSSAHAALAAAVHAHDGVPDEHNLAGSADPPPRVAVDDRGLPPGGSAAEGRGLIDAPTGTELGLADTASVPTILPPAAETIAIEPAAKLTFPPTAGEPDLDGPKASADDHAELAALVKPAPNTIPRGVSTAPAPARPATSDASAPDEVTRAGPEHDKSEPSHG